jgi:hypothetical protein
MYGFLVFIFSLFEGRVLYNVKLARWEAMLCCIGELYVDRWDGPGWQGYGDGVGGGWIVGWWLGGESRVDEVAAVVQ